MPTVLITGLNTAFDRKLAAIFVREGYQVFAIAGRGVKGLRLLPTDLAQAAHIVEDAAGKLDLYVDVSDFRHAADDFTIQDGLDEAVIRSVYEENVLRPMACLEAFLPLLDKGEKKRLCFLTSERASINETREKTGYAYNMSKAAIHNFFQMIANKLSPTGYSLRVYDPMPGKLTTTQSAEAALHYFVRRRGTEREDPLRDDETRLVFRDAFGREHSW